MTTKFKVGDRVRHKTMGTGVVVERTERFTLSAGLVAWRIDNYDYTPDDDHHSSKEMDLCLVEPAPSPADTRKRLREYTDLADGDVVVIAGIPLTYRNPVAPDSPCVWAEGQAYHVGSGAVSFMLVDEVRRKPRTKKRRVYEEVVDPTEVRVGDIHCFDGAENFVRRDEDLKVMSCAITRTVYRLVEETEVPR